MRAGKRRGQKGQLEIGFGMIFSIIVIIAIIAVAFYAIRYFLNIKECSEIGLFYDDLQREVNKAWAATGTTQKVFEQNLPGSVEAICLGDASDDAPVLEDEEKRIELGAEDLLPVRNLFIYPKNMRCGGLDYYTLEHVENEEFRCKDVDSRSGGVRLIISKSSTEALVRIEI